GGAILDAAVTLTNKGTAERRTVQSGADGIYRFLNLVPGSYKVDVEQSGFRHYTLDNITVDVEAAVRIDVPMQVGDVTQSVQVTAEAALMQTENASLSQVVNARSVQELPLNGRNVLNLIALAPGVVPQGSTDGASLTGKNVFAAGNYQIGGGTANQSAMYLDGVPLNTAYGNIVILVPSQDTVSDFRVQTNSSSAEYGRYAGGVINMASKSGTNGFHGGAYEFFRNNVLNAGDFFGNATGAGKPAFKQNQFGATLGGPIKKDKLFFFFGYEGYRQRQEQLFLNTVPTAAMLKGDFSNYRNASGGVIPIYDPLTQCGQFNNAACGTSAVQRLPFPGNVIPASRINPIAQKFSNFPTWGLPNIPGQPFTQNFNFSKNISTGGDNDQYTLRGDYSLSDKQRILARFTRFNTMNIPVDVYANQMYAADPWSPESFVTDQAVLADTYLFSPTTILDIRASYMRWYYSRIVGNPGIDVAATFGLPQYYNTLPALRGVADAIAVPTITVTGPNYTSYGSLLNYGTDNDYVLTPTLTKIMGRHTWKFGADLRLLQTSYFQLIGGGTFNFDNLFTSQNALSPGATGNGLASFLLGYPSGGNVSTASKPLASMRYQGYFVDDTFQATNKLTVNVGLRWEIPGVYIERFGRMATFNPSEVNPALNGTLVNGKPVLGAYDLVNTANHPESGLRPERFNLFAPRIGLAYRVNDKTVIRTGGGVYYTAANAHFFEGPYGGSQNIINTAIVGTINSGVTPVLDAFSNPYPNGIIPSPARLPNYQNLLLGISPGTWGTALQNEHSPYIGQWNFTVQHQLPNNIAVEAAYAGLTGVHLQHSRIELNSIPDQYLSMGTQLLQQVPNPFLGQIATGPLAQPTVQLGQLLLPFPQYTSVPNAGGYKGHSTYHSLALKVEKRFGSGGTVLGAYTLSKVLADVESLTFWLDNQIGGQFQGAQDFNNFRAEKSLSGFDARQRLSVSYVLDLPMGKGKKFLPGVKGVADKVVSGWGVNGVSTFQEGFPLSFTASPNLTGLNTGLRPNVAAGCEVSLSGGVQSRLNRYFNTSCYSVPAAYTFGNESRTDPVLRGPGIANFNFALFKRTAITERLNIEFRTEAFNLFNRVQFSPPNTVATTNANSTFGVISAQVNTPRLIQFGLRLGF
ncbi:MAG: carboxypeptidase regulatory-like domain-containing protein, partial [Bryobacteraceae bacterium]